MKRIILSLSICMMIILASLSGIATSSLKNNNGSLDDAKNLDEQTTIKITIHTLSGKETRVVSVNETFIKKINSYNTIPDYEDLLLMLPEEDQEYITNKLENDKQKLSDLIQRSNSLKNSIFSISDHASAHINSSVDEYFVNYLCKVKGVGMLILFPPFLPITPILWAGLLILNTNGTMGEINKAVEQAVMMPFVGLSFWAVQVYVFSGFAGVAIGFNTEESE